MIDQGLIFWSHDLPWKWHPFKQKLALWGLIWWNCIFFKTTKKHYITSVAILIQSYLQYGNKWATVPDLVQFINYKLGEYLDNCLNNNLLAPSDIVWISETHDRRIHCVVTEFWLRTAQGFLCIRYETPATGTTGNHTGAVLLSLRQ